MPDPARPLALTNPRTETLLPKSPAVLESFSGEVEEVNDASPVLESATALAANHRQQWVCEDECRDADEVGSIVRAKRRIDELNSRRVALVERIDRWVAARLSSGPEALLHTETLGSVIDRLAIEWVRTQQLMKATSADARPLARTALCQLNELATAYDDLVRDVSTGRRRLPSWRPLKRYGAER